MKTQWKSVSLSRHHPSILAGALVGGTAESRIFNMWRPLLDIIPSSPFESPCTKHNVNQKTKDWAKTLNPKPRIMHTSYNILDWLSDVFVMNEFLWYSTPTYLVQRVEFLCSPMTQRKVLWPRWVCLFLQYLLNQAKAIGKLCDVTASDGNVSSVQFTSLL
jgi:hypothetical protein